MIFSSKRNGRFLALCAVFMLGGTAGQAMDSSLNDLVGQLKSSDPAVRLSAIGQLGARGASAAEAVAPLTELLKDDDPTVRRQAVKALVAIRPGPNVMIPLFIQLMKDPDPGVQLRVLTATASAGEAAVPGLIEALKNDEVAYWACVLLRDIGPAAKAAVPALTEELQDPRPDIRLQAILALGAMKEASAPAVPQIAAALGDEHTRTAATFVLGEVGNIPAEAEKAIWANAKGDDPFLSTVSIWVLAREHAEDTNLRRAATEHLMAKLKDQDQFVRAVAAHALAALPPAPEITIPIWEKLMKDADATTVGYALNALATLGAPAVPHLVDILNKHEELRVEAAYTLGQMGPEAAAATDALAKLVADENLHVATEAIVALGKIGPAAKSAVPALCAALNKEGEKNGYAIIFTLGNIGPEAAAAEPEVLNAMEGEDKALAVIAARSYVEMQPASARAQAAAKAVPVLVAGLGEPLPETRKAAAESLAVLGPLARSAVPALEKASKDDVKAVREAAEKALTSVH